MSNFADTEKFPRVIYDHKVVKYNKQNKKFPNAIDKIKFIDKNWKIQDACFKIIHPHPKFGQRGIRFDGTVGGVRPPVSQADWHQRNQRDADREVPASSGQEGLHRRSAAVWLSRPAPEQTSRAHALRLEERQGEPAWPGTFAVRQSADLPRGRPRWHGVPGRGLGQVHPVR